MANLYTITSPEVSPKKETGITDDLNLQKHSIPLHAFEPQRKPNLVHEKVARLSISEPSIHEEEIQNSISAMRALSNDHLPKRRRSSAALPINSEDSRASRNNSISNGKILKKKKKASKPMNLAVFENSINKKVSIKDLRDLTLFLTNGTNNMPPWLRVKNRPMLPKVVVLFMPGLEAQDYGFPIDTKFSDNLPNLLTKFIEGNNIKDFQTLPVTSPGSRMSLFSAYNSFVNVGLTKNEKVERQEKLSKTKITINDLIMNLDQLLENGYPIHPDTIGVTPENAQIILVNDPEQPGWCNTIPFEHEGSHIFGLDCEMCLSGKEFVLTRVSILDFQNNVVYDELVKPDVPITNYLTQYSGITKEKLDPVTTTLKDVQNEILKMISSDDILIGHSLQSDFFALKIKHPKVVDTAVIFDHKAGPPFKPALKYLASEYLQIDIQLESKNGHDSIEDARTCVELTKLKILNGLTFGIAINTESLFLRIGEKAQKKSLILNDSIAKNLNCLASNTNDKSFYSKIRCMNDNEIFDNIRKNIDSFDLFIGRLRELEFARDYSQNRRSATPVYSTDNDVLQNFNKQVTQIYNVLPPGAVMLLISGCGNTKPLNALMSELNQLNKEERLTKRKEMETELEIAVAKARDGIATIILKNDPTLID